MSVRADLHTDSGLLRYIFGMDASMQDKARILSLIPQESDQALSILELGCGSGAVLELLSHLPGKNSVLGLDFSAKLLGHAARRTYGEKANVVLGRAKIQDYLPQGQFDAIILCSVLHEVWSQALIANPQTDNITAMAPLMKYCAKMLKPGGSIIIRDGVKVDSEPVELTFKNDTVRDKFFRFADDYTIEQLQFTLHPSSGRIVMYADQLYEFLTKYFYDENWDVEVKEEFGWAHQDDIWQLADEANLTVTHMETYQLEWLGEKWAQDFGITYTDGSTYTPDSTMLVRLTKKSS